MNRHIPQPLQSLTAFPPVAWQAEGKRYYNLSLFYRQRFGGPVWKIPLDAGMGCPNADGTLSRFGCTFCNVASFSPARRRDNLAGVKAQLLDGIAKLRRQRKAERFIAYFQAGTNTYADPRRLESLFREVIEVPGIVGLAVGTRPDCLPDEVLDVLQDAASRTQLFSLEIGLQSSNTATLRRINRGHGFAAFQDAVLRSHARGLAVCAHVMLGLPGETPNDCRETVRALSELPISGVKFHNTYVSKDTALARLYEAGMYRPLTREDYVETLIDCLELLSPHCVVERLTAETTDEYLIAPEWCRDKNGTLRLLERRLSERDTWQGKEFLARRHDST